MSSRTVTTLSPLEYGVVFSAKLVKFSSMKTKILQTYMLKRRRPRIDPWGAPISKSIKLLKKLI